jgi:phosphate transport system substrate-binding protein
VLEEREERWMKRVRKTLAILALSAASLCGLAREAGAWFGNDGFDADGEISVVARENGSGTRGAFAELFGLEERTGGGRRDLTTREAIIAKQTDVVMANIAGDAQAVGYISLGSLNGTVKAIAIDGAAPSAGNVKSGAYRAARPFYIATRGEPSGLARDFLDFILSAEGQAVAAKSYIAVNEGADRYAGKMPAGKIVIAGSSSVAPVMEKLKEAYAVINPVADVEIQQSDSSAGLSSVMEGTCDMAMSSRELRGDEIESLSPVRIALDGIAVIVNLENPAVNLTTEQVRDIFAGNVSVWSGVIR